MYVQCIKVQSIAIGPRTLKKLQKCPWPYYNLQYFCTLYNVKKRGNLLPYGMWFLYAFIFLSNCLIVTQVKTSCQVTIKKKYVMCDFKH